MSRSHEVNLSNIATGYQLVTTRVEATGLNVWEPLIGGDSRRWYLSFTADTLAQIFFFPGQGLYDPLGAAVSAGWVLGAGKDVLQFNYRDHPAMIGGAWYRYTAFQDDFVFVTEILRLKG